MRLKHWLRDNYVHINAPVGVHVHNYIIQDIISRACD